MKELNQRRSNSYAAGGTLLVWLLIFLAAGLSGGSRPKVYKTVKILIDAGADLNKPSKWGITPLMRAVIGEKTEFVRMLLNAGADPSVRCKEGFSALDYAKMHQVKLEIIEMLEEADEK